jgi:hypothetical protein
MPKIFKIKGKETFKEKKQNGKILPPTKTKETKIFNRKWKFWIFLPLFFPHHLSIHSIINAIIIIITIIYIYI